MSPGIGVAPGPRSLALSALVVDRDARRRNACLAIATGSPG